MTALERSLSYRRQRDTLDRSYLDPLVRELGRLLARPEIWDFYQQCWLE
ncbi:MAG: hypothetical protein ACPLPT_10720 [Moorellales bacterium]